jgi:lipopolysaccharide/colanic/teichoic acid biosynthesis glycosyltransferase
VKKILIVMAVDSRRLYLTESSMPRGPGTLYDRVVKRAFDVTAAAGALAVLSPFLAGVAIAVWRKHGRPVLFRQTRTGLDGAPFEIMKFRTMTDERDETGALLPDKERLTSLGQWLRSTSIDELPELFNVLRGEMSLVGPRPLLHRYMARYSARQQRRHECRPGITGWVAVNGRNTRTWAERFEQDVYYVENLGPVLDLLILAKTVLTVLGREGVDPGFADQMPEFDGT